MSFWVDDIADMLIDFGETFFIETAGNVTGIFQGDHEVASVYGVEVDSASPVLVCQARDVPDVSVGCEVAKVVAAGELRPDPYYVTSIQPDGTGVMSLVLSKDKL